jgi:outer membrane protein assembly factor BamB
MQNSLFIAEMFAGKARVTNYNPQSGEPIWITRYNTNSVFTLSVEGDSLSVSLNPDKFSQLNATTGENIKTLRTDDTIFLRTEQITYIRKPYLNTLSAYETNTDNLIWDGVFDKEIFQPPVFTDDMIYVRTDKALGRIYALERETGKKLWRTDRVVVSNIAVSKSTVFFLTQDGLLLEQDEQTGEIVSSVVFTNSPFLLAGDTEAGGYYVAYDEKTNHVFVVLGDSRQLFAFRMNNKRNSPDTARGI